MTTPTVTNHPTPPAPARASLTPKGRLTVQLIKLEAAIDGLTEAEQLGLAEALTPLVLVVDDSPEFLELMRELLEAHGYAVATCRWAKDAPTRIRQLRPDLLILDVRMQGVEDWTVVDQIKADPELAQIPCLVVSAAVDQLRGRSAEFASPGCEVLEKPFDVDDLVGAVARLLGSTSTQRVDRSLAEPSEHSS